jgi:uncharacterized protein (DUF2141 family)
LIKQSLCCSAALAAFAALAVAGPARAAEHSDCTPRPNLVVVDVIDVRSEKGTVTLDLFDRPEAFLKGKHKVLRVRVPAEMEATRLCFAVPAPGTYAIGLYHDRNANMRLDQGALGIPVEAYGVSNNPKIFLSAPSFEEAAFEVPSEGAMLEIRLKY